MEEHVSTQSLLSTAKYNMVIGLVLCWGFLVNWLMVTFYEPNGCVRSRQWLDSTYSVQCIILAWLLSFL